MLASKRPGDEFTSAGAVVPIKKGRTELVQAVDPSKNRAVVEMVIIELYRNQLIINIFINF